MATVKGDPAGPAVMLATADSIFPAILAKYWREAGLDVKIVTLGKRGEWLPDDVQVIDVSSQPKALRDRFWTVLRPLGSALQSHFVKRGKARFRRVTGKAEPDEWEWALWYWLENSSRLARTVQGLRPRFVFGQEVFAYGLATALCRGVPRILFPWGSDIYNSAESWWGAERVVTWALRNADLIVPSSSSAAEHLRARFGVPDEKVQSISWGIEMDELNVPSRIPPSEVRKKWGIPAERTVVQNCRRFRPLWGSEVVLDAFLKVAAQAPECHFVLIGGPGTEVEIGDARSRIAEHRMEQRFSLIEGQISFGEYCELAALADVYVSVVRRGDMRSASVLHLAATGAAPVIGETQEYRLMTRNGFAAELVSCEDSEMLAQAVQKLARDAPLRQRMAEQNCLYLKRHEDRPTQMARLLRAIDTVCETYYSGR